MAQPRKSENILTSKEEIKEYLGGVSNYLFNKYIKMGMPARFEDNRWCAHTENIDNFFKAYTKVSMSKMLDQIPDNGD
jgi:hypothetical protein